MRISVERRIGRPADEVFEYFADASNNPAWQRGMQSCDWITAAPIGLDSRYRQHARFAGRDVISVFEVTEYVAGHRIRIETVESSFPIQVTRTVEPDGDAACIVRASITGGPKVPWPFSMLARCMAQRAVESDYDRLQAVLGA